MIACNIIFHKFCIDHFEIMALCGKFAKPRLQTLPLLDSSILGYSTQNQLPAAPDTKPP